MLILEEFNDMWNYTFIVVALFAIAVGTIITLRKYKKNEMQDRREKRKSANN